MPKHDFFSPKAIANRIKAKGLQKLRWYCEMCQKQCRDENGFKCHQTSEAHLRQMKIFAENPGKVMTGYSAEFEANFVETLSRRHGTKRVAANVVYQEYISDRHHVHMNATRWETLTNFVKYLGKTGQCVVDETEKGWFIQWIDKDPAAIARQAQLEERRKHDRDDAERAERAVQRRARDARRQLGDLGASEDAADELRRDSSEKLSVSLGRPRDAAKEASAIASSQNKHRPPSSVFDDPGRGGDEDTSSSSHAGPATKRRRMIDALVVDDDKTLTEERPNEDAVDDDDDATWLRPGIVVKVVNKELAAGKYYRKKAAVREVVADGHAAVVRVLDSGDELRLDEDDLETVIPNVGKTVTLLRGRHAGQRATLLSIDLDAFAARVRVLPGERDADLVLERVAYEDLSKTAQ
mmetsp:Transcript_11366/g.46055  ORF Transcript_11366/g.46055 Transcript_11366/m.46055 type:complete len:410 (-) Transcript_11366:89-1318(-)